MLSGPTSVRVRTRQGFHVIRTTSVRVRTMQERHHVIRTHLSQGQNQARLSCYKDQSLTRSEPGETSCYQDPPLLGSEPGKAFMLSGPISVRVRTRQGFHVIKNHLFQGLNQARLSCYCEGQNQAKLSFNQDTPRSGSETVKAFMLLSRSEPCRQAFI
jgi:hypothetical protein